MYSAENWAWLVTWQTYVKYSNWILQSFCLQLTLNCNLGDSFHFFHFRPPPSKGTETQALIHLRNLGTVLAQRDELYCFYFFTFMRTLSETWYLAYAKRDSRLAAYGGVVLQQFKLIIKVCMGTQRFCWKSQFRLYFMNNPCCWVVFFAVCQPLRPI